MGKIIEFKLPDMLSAGYVGYETPVEREERPYNPGTIIPFRLFTDELQAGQDIIFQTEKQALELDGVKQEYLREQEAAVTPPKPRKRPLVVSALPGEPIPPEYPDFRPLLQRDGLILLGWAMWRNHGEYGLCYRANWICSRGRRRRYGTGFISELEDVKSLKDIMPIQRGDLFIREGIASNSYFECTSKYLSNEKIADIVFLAAPDLTCLTIPLFVQKLKEGGSTVNFDYEFSLGKAKELEFKRQAAEIEGMKMTGGENG